MPQIYFEYSDNVVIPKLRKVIDHIHNTLADQLPTDLRSCRTRIIKHENYVVGNGDHKNCFVYLAINVLKGRKKEQLELIANNISKYITIELNKPQNLELQISVSINELPEIYIKS
jgi:5-carboxymethyl-2-hydroxymuconate isomerase